MMLDTESSFSMAANRTFLTSCASSAPPHLGQSDYDYSGLPCPRVFGPDADQNADQLQRTARPGRYQNTLNDMGMHQNLRFSFLDTVGVRGSRPLVPTIGIRYAARSCGVLLDLGTDGILP
jgi:hypothetical protein